MTDKKLQFDGFPQEELKEKLWNANAWLILRIDEAGLHLHLKDEGNMALLPLFLAYNPEIYEMVKGSVEEIIAKEEAAKNGNKEV